MNKLEANIALIIITFYAAVQYAFLSGVPDSVSHFGFITITNLIGFIIAVFFFFGELFRLDKRQVKQSIILSAELVVVNSCMLAGAQGTSATVSACILSAYFVFVPVIGLLVFHEKPDVKSFPGIVVVLIGLFLMMEMDVAGMMNRNVLLLIVADISFAFYILTLGKVSENSNPSIIAMGQMFFSAIFSLIMWIGETLFFGGSFRLPASPLFWGGVLYISFFIRGLYGIVQLYAQRYITALNTAMIFSTEIVMTMLVSPLLTIVFGTPTEEITALKVTGALIMVGGILIADESVRGYIIGGIKNGKKG